MAGKRHKGSAKQRAGTGIVIHGVKELEESLNKVEKKLRDRVVNRAAMDAANVIAVEAKRILASKVGDKSTGALGRSIHVKKNHVSKAIKSATKYLQKARDIERTSYAVVAGEGFFQGKTWYGGIVEFGSVKWAGHPFMRPAAKSKRDVIRQLFRKAVREVTQNSARRRANAAVNAIDTRVD